MSDPSTPRFVTGSIFVHVAVMAVFGVDLANLFYVSLLNLGHPPMSTLFNWGRATLGTIPFVTLGRTCGPSGDHGLAVPSGSGRAALATFAGSSSTKPAPAQSSG